MERFDKKDLWVLFFIFLVSLVGVCCTFGYYGNPMIDIGREFYIAERVSQGGILYKEIFNIYGPLSYQINGLLFKLFGIHMKVLGVFGGIVGILIMQSLYCLAREFLNKSLSAVITFVCVGLTLFRITIFNFCVPYSFGMSYGLLCVFISLILLVRYIKDENTEKILYLSAVFAGAAAAFKYDYVSYALVFPICFLLLKKVDLKVWLLSLFAYFLIPLISVIPIIISGFGFGDIILNIKLFKRIVSAPSLIHFYSHKDIYPNLQALKPLPLIKFGLMAAIPYFLCVKLPSQIAYILGGISIILLYFLFGVDFCFPYFLMVYIFVGVLIARKKITDKAVWCLLLACIFLSLKNIFVSFLLYGGYVFPLIFLCFVVIWQKHIIRDNMAFKTVLIVTSLIYLLEILKIGYDERLLFQGNFETTRGIYTAGLANSPEVNLIRLIQYKTELDDKVVILPEGHIINFLTDRKSDDMYSNLIPMYVEAFGEQNIINHFAQNKPDYFVLSTRNMEEYGKPYICVDYAQDLCAFIFANYDIKYKIEGKPSYIVLKERK